MSSIGEEKQFNARLAGKTREEFIDIMLFAFCLPASAQQPTKRYRVGYLSPTLASAREVFRETLRGLGYVEGQNIHSEWRLTDQRGIERLSRLASESERRGISTLDRVRHLLHRRVTI